jgi:hypothetical protein
VTGRYGPDKRRRMLRCRACKARYSEPKGTPMFDARLPPEEVGSVLEPIAEECDFHDESVALSPRTREVQFDERWAFVAK